MLPLKADFVFCSFLYIVLLVDLSVFDSYCILKFNKASILGEGGGGDCADSLSPPRVCISTLLETSQALLLDVLHMFISDLFVFMNQDG